MDGVLFADIEGESAVGMDFEHKRGWQFEYGRWNCQTEFPVLQIRQGFGFINFLVAEIDHEIDEFRKKDVFLQNCACLVAVQLHFIVLWHYLALVVFILELLLNYFLDYLFLFNLLFDDWFESGWGNAFAVSEVAVHAIAWGEFVTIEIEPS